MRSVMHNAVKFFLYLQKITFKYPFFAPPVVVVSPRLRSNINNSRLSGSGCNAVTVWVEVKSFSYLTSLFYLCEGKGNPSKHLRGILGDSEAKLEINF